MSKQQRRLILESYQIYINPWYSVICIWKTFPLQREDSHVEHCALQTRAKSTKHYKTAKIFCIMDWISRTNTYTQHAVFDKADWPSSKQTFKKKKKKNSYSSFATWQFACTLAANCNGKNLNSQWIKVESGGRSTQGYSVCLTSTTPAREKMLKKTGAHDGINIHFMLL